MEPLWALLAALALVPICPGPAAKPCPTITAYIRQDNQVTIPINFTGKTFHRAQGSLDNACLVHIVLHEPTPSPLLTHATSPEPAEPTGWLRLSYPIFIAVGIIVAIIIVFSLCLYTCGSWHSWQRLNCVQRMPGWGGCCRWGIALS